MVDIVSWNSTLREAAFVVQFRILIFVIKENNRQVEAKALLQPCSISVEDDRLKILPAKTIDHMVNLNAARARSTAHLWLAPGLGFEGLSSSLEVFRFCIFV